MCYSCMTPAGCPTSQLQIGGDINECCLSYAACNKHTKMGGKNRVSAPPPSPQPTTGYTAQKEASIVLSHTAAWSICGASQGHERDLICGTVPLIAPSSFKQFSCNWGLSHIMTQSILNLFLKLMWGPVLTTSLVPMKWMKDSHSVGQTGGYRDNLWSWKASSLHPLCQHIETS